MLGGFPLLPSEEKVLNDGSKRRQLLRLITIPNTGGQKQNPNQGLQSLPAWIRRCMMGNLCGQGRKTTNHFWSPRELSTHLPTPRGPRRKSINQDQNLSTVYLWLLIRSRVALICCTGSACFRHLCLFTLVFQQQPSSYNGVAVFLLLDSGSGG